MRFFLIGIVALAVWLGLLISQKWTGSWVGIPLAIGMTCMALGIGTLNPAKQGE